mgnify:CR=1 FL=1
MKQNLSILLFALLFAFATISAHEISLNNQLPEITNTHLVIDGRSQSGYNFHNPVIQINGQEVLENGIIATNNTVEIYGLLLKNFTSSAISLNNNTLSVIEENILTKSNEAINLLNSTQVKISKNLYINNL